MMRSYKRFMVFDPQPHDALGGLDDCRESFDSFDDARRYAIKELSEDAYIFDRERGIDFNLRIPRGATFDFMAVK